jgi:hypothetical protein
VAVLAVQVAADLVLFGMAAVAVQVVFALT